MKPRTYYEILGVSRDAALEEITAAKNALAKVYHPDANVHKDIDTTAFMQEILEAYRVLSNPEKGSVTAIWAAWDEPAIGATQALMEAGRDEVIVTGADGNEQAISLIKEGPPLKATVKQNFEGMAQIVYEQMESYYGGQELEKGELYAPATLITTENVGEEQ